MPLDYTHIVHLFFPPSPDEMLLQKCTEATFTEKINTLSFQGCTTLLPFADPTVKAAIHLNKYHHHTYAQKLLGAALAIYLKQLTDTHIIIPIPLSKKRFRVRGYNQSEEIALRAVRHTSQAILHKKVLIRTRDTQPQTALSKKDRIRNMRGAFTPHRKHALRITGAHIVLLDDVVTTGATMHAAKNTLLQYNPASITCIALAH